MKIAVVVLLLLLCGVGWRYYQTEQRLLESKTQLAKMEVHAINLEKKIVELEEQLAQAQGRSLEEIAENVNNDLIDGWQTILDQFKNKLEGASDKLIETLEEMQKEEMQNDSKQIQQNDERT